MSGPTDDLIRDDLDRDIVARLGADARISHSRLGRLLGVSEKTIRNRLAGLTERGLRFRIDLGAPPGPVRRMIFLITTEPGYTDSIHRTLRERTDIDVRRLWGRWTFLVTRSLTTTDEAARFDDWVRRLPGVATVESGEMLDVDDAAEARPVAVELQLAALTDRSAITPPGRGAARQLLQLGRAVLGADRGSLLRYRPAVADEPDRPREISVVLDGFPDDYLDRLRAKSDRLGELSAIEQAAVLGHRVVVEDLRAPGCPPQLTQLLDGEGYRSFVSFPLRDPDTAETLGVLSLYYTDGRSFPDTVLDGFEALLGSWMTLLGTQLETLPEPG